MAGGWISDGNRDGCWGTRGDGENAMHRVGMCDTGCKCPPQTVPAGLLLHAEEAFTPA